MGIATKVAVKGAIDGAEYILLMAALVERVLQGVETEAQSADDLLVDVESLNSRYRQFKIMEERASMIGTASHSLMTTKPDEIAGDKVNHEEAMLTWDKVNADLESTKE